LLFFYATIFGLHGFCTSHFWYLLRFFLFRPVAISPLGIIDRHQATAGVALTPKRGGSETRAMPDQG
jgi:hypothetical protein